MEALDIVEHIRAGLVAVAIDVAVGPFDFQRRKEALHRRTVPDVSGPAHGAGDAIVDQQALKLLAAVLRPLVRVMQPGVGTNRYSYAFNDPVNKLDPNGNWAWGGALVQAVWGFFTGAATAATAEVASDIMRDGEMNGNGAIASAITSLGSIASPFPAEEVQGRPQQRPTQLAREISIVAGQALGILPRPQYEAARGALVRSDPVRGQDLLDRYLGTAFTGTGTHGNSLQSPNENMLYHLYDGSEKVKIGITSTPGGGRYTEAELNGRRYEEQPGHFNNRLEARIEEVRQNLNYVQEYGRFPRDTFRW